MSDQSGRLSMPRTLKIGSFHIGSAFADLLARLKLQALRLPALVLCGVGFGVCVDAPGSAAGRAPVNEPVLAMADQ